MMDFQNLVNTSLWRKTFLCLQRPSPMTQESGNKKIHKSHLSIPTRTRYSTYRVLVPDTGRYVPVDTRTMYQGQRRIGPGTSVPGIGTVPGTCTVAFTGTVPFPPLPLFPKPSSNLLHTLLSRFRRWNEKTMSSSDQLPGMARLLPFLKVSLQCIRRPRYSASSTVSTSLGNLWRRCMAFFRLLQLIPRQCPLPTLFFLRCHSPILRNVLNSPQEFFKLRYARNIKTGRRWGVIARILHMFGSSLPVEAMHDNNTPYGGTDRRKLQASSA